MLSQLNLRFHKKLVEALKRVPVAKILRSTPWLNASSMTD